MPDVRFPRRPLPAIFVLTDEGCDMLVREGRPGAIVSLTVDDIDDVLRVLYQARSRAVLALRGGGDNERS